MKDLKCGSYTKLWNSWKNPHSNIVQMTRKSTRGSTGSCRVTLKRSTTSWRLMWRTTIFSLWKTIYYGSRNHMEYRKHSTTNSSEICHCDGARSTTNNNWKDFLSKGFIGLSVRTSGTIMKRTSNTTLEFFQDIPRQWHPWCIGRPCSRDIILEKSSRLNFHSIEGS